MKFTIEKNLLIENLNNVSKAITTKNIIPILSGIKFELNEEGLYLTASDSELTIQSFLEKGKIKTIEKEGTAILKSKNLIEIIKKMPDEFINFELIDNSVVNIFTKQNKFSLNCMNSKEYPKFKVEDSKTPIFIKSDIFKTMINKIDFAISNQESRPLLTGINIKINGNIFDLTATDSYRLANKYFELKEVYDENINIVVPGKNLIELEKILTTDDELEIHIFNSKILFKYSNIIFQSNLISGTYPNTSALIPSDFEMMLEVNLKNLYDAIDRASLLSQTMDKNFIKMSIKNKLMKISSYTSETGKSEEEIEIDQNSNKDLEISFSARFMLEALRTIQNEKVILLLNSEVKPMILIKSPTDESLIQLVLPIKTY